MRELFASDDFDLKTFLNVNKDIPIDELLKRLDGISKAVQNELFELINGDLVHFKKIISEVCEVDIDSIKQYRSQFENDKIAKEKNYLAFKEYFEEIDKKYQRLKYVQKKKEFLVRSEKAQKYIESFKERQSLAENSLYELEISVKRYNWLLKFTTDYSQELIESDIPIELSKYNERLQEILEIQMERLLKNSEFEDENIVLLLEMSKEMNKLNLFEASFKLSIVYAAMESFLPQLNFNLFIDRVIEFILTLRTKWNEVLKGFYEEEEFKFWTRTVLTPILNWIIERFDKIFIPNDLNEFKTNFEKGLNFISKLENEFFIFEDELLFFRSQISWINFMKKWSLHQYFQKRVKQIAVDDEDSVILVTSLKYFWSDEVVLKPLIPKFLKITLQIFRKFISSSFENYLNHKNPKIFLKTFLKKQLNLKQFPNLIEENLKEEFIKNLDSLEEGLTDKIITILRNESEIVLIKSRDNLIPGIEKLYDQIIQKEEFEHLNLETLKILKEEEIEFDQKHLIQQILLKFNRIIFKLIDEKRLKPSEYPNILIKMKEIEGEVEELGYFDILNEEFWLEIKAAIN